MTWLVHRHAVHCNRHLFESLVAHVTCKWLSVQCFGRQSTYRAFTARFCHLPHHAPCLIGCVSGCSPALNFMFLLVVCCAQVICPHVKATDSSSHCQQTLGVTFLCRWCCAYVKATDSSSHLSLQIVLRKLSGADPEGRRHCIKLLRTFDYRGHLCMAFEAMVCLSAACTMLTPLQLCPVKPSSEAL